MAVVIEYETLVIEDGLVFFAVVFLSTYFRTSPNFLTFKEAKNRFQGTNSARLCSLAGRYDNPIPTQFLAHMDSLKIPAQFGASCLLTCQSPNNLSVFGGNGNTLKKRQQQN
jgi:hypothetical protein